MENLSKEYPTCKICGRTVDPYYIRCHKYSVTRHNPFFIDTVLDAVDCPNCGCQILIQERLPVFNENEEGIDI